MSQRRSEPPLPVATLTAPARARVTRPVAALPRADVLAARVRLLVAVTITYNLVEAVVALTAGARASSTALVGFGLDSLIEVSSAAAVAWQFSAHTAQVRQDRERRALRVIAGSFFALAGYVAVESVRSLAGGAEPATSRVGLVLAAVSLAVMPVLSLAQRRAGRELGSASAVADSHQTLLCTYLSAVLLVGLALNGLFGWGWADPLAGLVIAGLAAAEGRQAWRGEGCCAPTGSTVGLGAPSGTTEKAAADCCGPNCGCCP
ncbi:MAG: cation transporter [Mycobacteriales bacterium]